MEIEELKGMLQATGLPIRASYRPGEVCAFLGISARTFWRYTSAYEVDCDTGGPVNPCSLKSFLLRRERRVNINELLDFINRNDTYERSHSA